MTLILLAAAAALLLALRAGTVRIPDRWAPWVPLEIGAEPNFLTSYKLSRLSGDASLCRQVLSRATLTYELLPDRQTGPGCGLFDAVRIERTTARVSGPFSLTCRAAVSLAMWEHHVLQPAAMRHFGSPVERLEHFGSYSCRNVYGRLEGTRSRHATAEALDVAGVTLANGQRIRVLRDWNTATPEGRFLRELRDGACRFFDAVLSADYNAAHRDHLHLDRGSFRVCR